MTMQTKANIELARSYIRSAYQLARQGDTHNARFMLNCARLCLAVSK